MKISFHGADRNVTGSCHLVECAGKKILIDCGLYQGGRELTEENAAAFGFEASEIDYLLLTHAHLDHCGRISLLAKNIFTLLSVGEILSFYILDRGGFFQPCKNVIFHHSDHRSVCLGQLFLRYDKQGWA